MSDLQRRALAAGEGGRDALTAAGRATWAKLAQQVDLTWRRLVDGIAQQEYLATVEVLQRMTTNLESAPQN